MKVTALETLHCDAGWRNYHFLKLSTDEGIVGWAEYDEGFGSPGVTTVIERMAPADDHRMALNDAGVALVYAT